MSQIAEQLNKVVDKTARLIELCAALQEENDLLKLENQSLRVGVNTSREKIKELEEKLRVIKLARSLEALPGNGEGTSEKTLDIKQKISEFVREIDKCIVLLKK
jgi:predicted  nucleic acid-binding Zn-ribbon protein